MKDTNGIVIECENCRFEQDVECIFCKGFDRFKADDKTLKARIKELQDELTSDKYNYESWAEIKAEHEELKARNKELKVKLTETVKLLSEKNKECGELEIELKVTRRFLKSLSEKKNAEISKTHKLLSEESMRRKELETELKVTTEFLKSRAEKREAELMRMIVGNLKTTKGE